MYKFFKIRYFPKRLKYLRASKRKLKLLAVHNHQGMPHRNICTRSCKNFSSITIKILFLAVFCLAILRLYNRYLCRKAKMNNSNMMRIYRPKLRTVKTASVVKNMSGKYYVYTSQCQMPVIDPFTSELRKIYHPKPYQDCSKDEPIITLLYDVKTKRYKLHKNTTIIAKYAKSQKFSAEGFYCCYKIIQRIRDGGDGPKGVKLLKCQTFPQGFVVPKSINYIITECFTKSKTLVQTDAFTLVQYRKLSSGKHIKSKMLKNQNLNKPSILIIGIDSLSRINIRRTMPLTLQYLQRNNWFELQGYNKAADNTFYNYLSLFASFNRSTATKKCSTMVSGSFEKPKCNLIWYKFREYGYRTAYAEDTSEISTFNSLKPGFIVQPTDYYFRPMGLVIEKSLPIKKLNNLPFCVGRKHYADYIYDYALQLANVYQDEPYFGLFWTNSFSHNDFKTPASMDKKIVQYLRTMERNGILNRTIVFFLSDHGMRWGSLLKLSEGYFEERLPMMFLSLPTWYRNKYPTFVRALQVNRNRLTTPFDIYATFKQILEMGEPKKCFPQVTGAITGISIFEEIPENRTCLDAGISEHWCACVPYEDLPVSDRGAQKAVGLIIDEMNKYISKRGFSNNCKHLKFNMIVKARKKMVRADDSRENKEKNKITYNIYYTVSPGNHSFHATGIYVVNTSKIEVEVEEISRLDIHKKTGHCVKDSEAKKYCICATE